MVKIVITWSKCPDENNNILDWSLGKQSPGGRGLTVDSSYQCQNRSLFMGDFAVSDEHGVSLGAPEYLEPMLVRLL